MRIKILLINLLVPVLVFGTLATYSPLSDQTILGTWEGLLCSPVCSPGAPPVPLIFYHMELNKNGVSFLSETTVHSDMSPLVRRLLSSEIKDGKIKLHFGSSTSKQLRNVTFPEIWITGNGTGNEEIGAIIGRVTDDPSKKGEDNIRFDKGTWTRAIGEASKKAEEEIKKAALKP